MIIALIKLFPSFMYFKCQIFSVILPTSDYKCLGVEAGALRKLQKAGHVNNDNDY